MAALPFLDTNVLVRHILGDEPMHSPLASAYIERIVRGDFAVRTADTVIFETIYTLQRFYRVPRPSIRDSLLPIIRLPGIVLPGKSSYGRVLDLYVNQPSLSIADCYHAVLVRRLKLTEIV